MRTPSSAVPRTSCPWALAGLLLATLSLAGCDRAAPRTVAVFGEGDARVSPDIAYVSVGTQTLEQSPRESLRRNAEIMGRTLEATVGFGIPRDQIKTVQYSLWAQYDYEEGRQVFRGFQANNTVEIPVTDLQQVGPLMEALVVAGANNIQGVNYSIKDLSAASQQALGRALGDARRKAESLVRDASEKEGRALRLGEMLRMEEVAAGPAFFGAEGGAPVEPVTPLLPGQLKVQARVRVEYAVEG